MAQQSVCAHCGFRNFSLSHFCARCEEPLRGHDQPQPPSHPPVPPPQRAPARPQPPPAAARAAAAAEPRQTFRSAQTAPLPKPAGAPADPPDPSDRTAITVAPAWRPKPQARPEIRPEIRPEVRPELARQVEPAANKVPTPASAQATQMLELEPQEPNPAGFASFEPTAAHLRPTEPDPLPAANPAAPLRRKAPPPAPSWQTAEATEPAPEMGQQTGQPSPLAAPPYRGRKVAALAIDASVVVCTMAAHIAVEMAWMRGGWPSERATGLEAVAWWIYVYHRCVRRVLLGGLLISALQAAWGVRFGSTLGRWLCNLTLVAEGQPTQPREPLPWSQAAWHLLGGTLCLLSMGAGVYWMVVDARGRTWANLLSRTTVVRRA